MIGLSYLWGLYEPRFSCGLVSVITPFWEHDMSVDMVVAMNVQHGSLRKTAGQSSTRQGIQSDPT